MALAPSHTVESETYERRRLARKTALAWAGPLIWVPLASYELSRTNVEMLAIDTIFLTIATIALSWEAFSYALRFSRTPTAPDSGIDRLLLYSNGMLFMASGSFGLIILVNVLRACSAK